MTTVTVRKCSRSLHRAIVEEGWNGIVVRNNIIILLILLTNKNKEGLSSLYPVSRTRMRSYSVFLLHFTMRVSRQKGKTVDLDAQIFDFQRLAWAVPPLMRNPGVF